MMRTKQTFTYRVGGRLVEVSAFDSVGVDDLYEVMVKASLHRRLTGEDLFEPARREVKDYIIKTNRWV